MHIGISDMLTSSVNKESTRLLTKNVPWNCEICNKKFVEYLSERSVNYTVKVFLNTSF